jgi:hypothetical protein
MYALLGVLSLVSVTVYERRVMLPVFACPAPRSSSSGRPWPGAS